MQLFDVPAQRRADVVRSAGATDIAHALPVTIIAAASHALLGHVDSKVLVYLLIGSIPGVVLASRLAIRLPTQLTNSLIALMLGAVSARMLIG